MTWQRVVRDETQTVRIVVSVGPVDGDALGTFGWFIAIRIRGRRDLEDTDRRRYGHCVICRRPLTDDEQIHMVFSVVRNAKTVGNRLCCAACAATHATFYRLEKVTA